MTLAGFVLAVGACNGSDNGSGNGKTAAEISASLRADRVYPDISFTDPVMMLRAPSDTSRWFVVQQNGKVVYFDDRSDVAGTTMFLDISDRLVTGGVHGMLGMAFHPDFPLDPRVFATYTALVGGDVVLRVSEFVTTDAGMTLDPDSEQIIFALPQVGGHNDGGHVLFGPDGMLYVAAGDGGHDQIETSGIGYGQTLNTLEGKILRLDVDNVGSGMLYAIPPDNPFAANARCNTDGSGTQNCPEIYAWGFRNPWRWSFDMNGAEMWLGDVGASEIEEIDRVHKGGNYGWRCKEGTHDTVFACGTPGELVPPVAEYDHSLGIAVAGGFVYRGRAISDLVGRYVFGDWGSGRIWNIAGDIEPTLELSAGDSFESGLAITSFAQDFDGELFIVDYGGGLYRLAGS